MLNKLQAKIFFCFLIFFFTTSIFCQIDPITNLRVIDVRFRQVTLQWTAPQTDIVQYQIRLSTYRVLSNEYDWENNSSDPGYPYRIFINTNTSLGQTETYTITGLKNGTGYFFAIKSTTDNITWSSIDISSPRPYALPTNSPPDPFSPNWPVAYVVVTSQTVIPFDWEDASDVDIRYGDTIKYELYYSTVETTLNSTPPSLLGGKVEFVVNITTSYVEVPSNYFLDNTTYYWRVKVIDSEGSFSWSWYFSPKESRFVVNNIYQPPGSPSLLTPVSSTATTPVFFDWSDTADPDPQETIKYFVYISSQSENYGFVSQVSDITWSSYTLASVFGGDWVENTTYWWYVVAEDSFGLKSFSATSWFVINDLNEPPIQNFLFSPGATIYYQLDVNNPNHIIFTLHPTFYWSLSFDPDPLSSIYYQLFISSYSELPDELNSLFYTTEKIYTSFYYLTSLVLENKTTYFWRLRIWDEPYSGYAVYSSTTFWFYTCVENKQPSAATLIYPINETTTSYFYPTFVWQKGEDFGFNAKVSSQTLVYWTDSDTTTISLSADTTFYVPATPLKNNSTYFWQIITYDNGYPPPQLSSTSIVGKFFIKNSSPTSFELLSPQNGSIVETQNVQLFWSEAEEVDFEPVSYTLVYSTDNFKTFVSSSGLTTTSFVLYNVLDNTTYFWYVYAHDVWGFTTASLTFYFVVDNIPQNPQNFVLISPLNDTILYNTSVTFYWQQTFDPDPYDPVSYVLKVSTTSDLQQLIFTTQTVSTSFYLPVGVLEVNTTYYWTVVAISSRSGQTFADSSPYSFFVFNTPPSNPVLLSPVNKEIISVSSVTLNWLASIDYQFHKLYYELYITTSQFQTYIKIILPGEQNYFNLENLLDDTTYWWYVVAIDTYQTKSPSDIYEFYTSYENLPPSTPIVLSPQNNETIFLPYIIRWTESFDYDIFDFVSYRIEISTTENFSTILKEFITQETSFELIDLDFTLPSSTYFLRIVAYDAKNLETVSSSIRFFIAKYSPLIFTPLNNEVITKLPIKFSFSKVEPIVIFDTITYRIVFSSYTDFRVKTEITTQSTFYVFYKEGFLNPSTYYLYLEVKDSFGHLAKTQTQTFVIPNTPPPAPKKITISQNTIEWQEIVIDNLWQYRIYFGIDVDNIHLVAISTVPYLKLEKLYNGFYTVKTVNHFGVESDDNVFVRVFQEEQVDFYFSEDKQFLVSIPKTENIVVQIKKLEIDQPNVVFAYDILSEKQKTEKFCELQFVKPQEDKNYYVEFFDGYNWLSIPFSQDKNKVYIVTQYLGKYRLVETAELKLAEIAILGCSPKKKIITPNNDGINDYIEFYYYSAIEGYVYDLNLSKVCRLKHRNPNILYFDGKNDEGKLLPPGIYIYQINATKENKMFKGTIVIKY